MRKLIHFAAIFLILFLPLASSIENNLYISVPDNESFFCTYLTLPDDLGVRNLERSARIEIKTNEDSWFLTKNAEINLKNGMRMKMPMCIRYEGKSEGDFSLYNLKISSSDVNVERNIRGGFCVSRYEDVDFSEEGGNACDILNDNADLFDVSFDEDESQVESGGEMRKTIYVTSYAKLKIELEVESDVETSFKKTTVSTSRDEPIKSKSFTINAPEELGRYMVNVKARVVGCNLPLCFKTRRTFINVVEKVNRSDVSVSVVPRSINVRGNEDSVRFMLIVVNHGNETNATLKAQSEELNVTPREKSVVLEEGKNTFNFYVSGFKKRGLYAVKFRVSLSSDEEHEITAYLSSGEFLSDAEREGEELSKGKEKSVKDMIRNAVNEYREKSEGKEYGDDLEDYSDLKQYFSGLRGGEGEKEEGGVIPTNASKRVKRRSENGGEGLNFLMLIPIVLAIVAITVFITIKKSKVKEDIEYPGYTDF